MRKIVLILVVSAIFLQMIFFPTAAFAQDAPKKSPEDYLTPEERNWERDIKGRLQQLKDDLTYHLVIIQRVNDRDYSQWSSAYIASRKVLYDGYANWSPTDRGTIPTFFYGLSFQSSPPSDSVSAGHQIVDAIEGGVILDDTARLQALKQEETVLLGLLATIKVDEDNLNGRIAAIASQRQKEEEQKKAKENKFLEFVQKVIERLFTMFSKSSDKTSGSDNKTQAAVVSSQGTKSAADAGFTGLQQIRYCRIMYKMHIFWSSGNQSDGYAGQEEWAYVQGGFNSSVYTGERIYTYPNSTLPIKMKYEVTLNQDVKTGEIKSADFKFYRETTDSIKDPPRGPDVIIKLHGENVQRRQDKETGGGLYFESDGTAASLDPSSSSRSASWDPNAKCCWSTKWSANKDSFIKIELSPSIPKPR